MGTRNLTVVISDNEYKLAQYCQWDGYPDGQGVTALEFCRNNLQTEEGRALFIEKLGLVRFVTDDEKKKLFKDMKIDVSTGFINMSDSARFAEKHPYFSRDHGAEILGYILVAPDMRPKEVVRDDNLGRKMGLKEWKLIPNEGDDRVEEVATTNQVDFAGDSLFCEWAYVIDLDNCALEAYRGFNKKTLSVKNNRFAEMEDSPTNDYEPIKQAGRWTFDNLPSNEEFCNELQPPDEEEDES